MPARTMPMATLTTATKEYHIRLPTTWSPHSSRKVVTQREDAMALNPRYHQSGQIIHDIRAKSQVQRPHAMADMLPPGVLCKIFATCARITSHDPNWSWITVTHVCASWRRVALAQPSLWANIDFTAPRLTTLTLRRAKSSPLFIRTSVENRNIKQLHQVLHTSSLIHDIDIVSSLHGFQSLTEALTRPHPRLRSLTIVILGRRDDREIVHYKVPLSSHGNPLPSLTNLELHRCPFALVSSRFISLKHLSLFSLPPSERPEMRAFLLTLAGFPFLQTLTLVDAFPKPPVFGSISSTGGRIPVPRLQSICLQGGIVEISQLLDHLFLPHTTRIKCTIDHLNATTFSNGRPDPTHDVRRLAKVLGEHLSSNGAKVLPLQKLVLTSREESFRWANEKYDLNPDFRQSMRIRGFRADSGWDDAGLDLALSLRSHPCEDEVIIGWLMTLWKVLPLGNVQSVAFQNVDVITQKSWQKLLRSLPSVSMLEVNGYAPSGLAWALLLNANANVDGVDGERVGGEGGLLLPCLKDVFLYDVDCFQGGFMMSSTMSTNSHRDLDDSRFMDVMLFYFQLRNTLSTSLRLRTLRLFQCRNVPGGVLKDSRGWVENLYWDRRGEVDEAQDEFQEFAHYRKRCLVGNGQLNSRHFRRLLTLQERL